MVWLRLVVPRARILIVTLWAGSLWTIGYLVAPILFATLPDRTLAGTIAGSLFRAQGWLTLVCGALLLLILQADKVWPQRRLCQRLVLAMLACSLIGFAGLQPMMAALREAAGATGVMDGAARSQFGLLHGLASALYLMQSLLAVPLVMKSR